MRRVTMHSRFLASLAAVAALAAAAPAFAAEPSPKPGKGAPGAAPKPKEHADELFEQATAALDAGRFTDAERLLQEAWGLKQTHDIAGNLGLVRVKLGKLPEGAQLLAWALEHFPPTESDAARHALEQELAKARAQIGAVRIHVNVAGAEVAVNGKPLSAAALAGEVFVAPGGVTVSASREGYVAVSQAVTVAAGAATREVTLTMVPVGEPGRQRSVVPGVVLGSAAGVALVTGIVLVGVGAKQHATNTSLNQSITQAHHSCVPGAPNFDPQCSTLESGSSTADTLGRASIGLFVGAGAAATGSLLYFLWPASKPRAQTGIRVLPTVSPVGSGLLLSGSF